MSESLMWMSVSKLLKWRLSRMNEGMEEAIG